MTNALNVLTHWVFLSEPYAIAILLGVALKAMYE